MDISITIRELRDYMVGQARRQNFWPSYICYAVGSMTKNEVAILPDETINVAVMRSLSEWFGFTLSSGGLGIDENFSDVQLTEWMTIGHRVVNDENIGLPHYYTGYVRGGRMLSRIGMLTWLMDANGVPGDSEIVISFEE